MEVADWNCCGAGSAGPDLAESLALRNLALAGKTGLDLLVPCAACYNTEKLASPREDAPSKSFPEENTEIKDTWGRSRTGGVRVLHPLELLTQPEIKERLRALIKVPLTGWRLAAYYGCLLNRPGKSL
jgi:heterodisulfide reductase subunit B